MNRRIGATDLEVFPIGLGAMPLGIRGSLPLQDAIEVIHAALDEGINFIDTANVYCTDNQDIGLNERTISQALDTIGSENVVVATKGGLERPQGRWERRGSPQRLRSACEKSLQDLNVEVIDLYQLHAPDPMVPFAESIGELARLQSEGKILNVGLSNIGRDELDEAMDIVTIATVQNRCNIYHAVDIRSGFVDYCKDNHVTYIAYSPVGGGGGHTTLRDNVVLSKLASKYKCTVYQIVLAWLLKKSDNILPIPGASRVSSAVSSAHAVNVELTSDEVAKVDRIGTA